MGEYVSEEQAAAHPGRNRSGTPANGESAKYGELVK